MRVKSICGLLLMGVLAACGGTVAEEAGEDPQSPDAEVSAAWTPCEIGDPVCEYTNGTSCSYRYETTKPCCDPGEGGRQTCTCTKSTGKWMCPLPIY